MVLLETEEALEEEPGQPEVSRRHWWGRRFVGGQGGCPDKHVSEKGAVQASVHGVAKKPQTYLKTAPSVSLPKCWLTWLTFFHLFGLTGETNLPN